MKNPLTNLSNKNERRLDKELVFLFGKQLVAQGMQLRPEDLTLEADLVAEGAKQLIEHKGHPEAQRMIVQCMDDVMRCCDEKVN